MPFRRLKVGFAALVFLCVPAWAFPNAALADPPAPLDTVLPCGIRVIAQQEPSTQLVAINVFIRVGAAQETADDAGIGNFVASTLLAGTSNQDQETMSEQIGMLGGNVTAIWQPDMTQVKTLTLASQFDDASYLVSDVLKNANFTDAAVENARHDLLSNMQNQSDDLFQEAYDNLRTAAYDGTPYARPTLGSPDTIRRLTARELRAFFDRYYTPDRIVIAVVGNVDPNHVVTVFGQNLQDFPRHAPERPFSEDGAVTEVHPLAKPITVKRYRPDITAGYIMVGFPAPGAGAVDYPAMMLANALLGSMKTSLLFVNLREKKQYGYEVGSLYGNQIGESDCTGYIISAPTHADAQGKQVSDFGEVRDALLAQFRAMAANPPTDAELTRAKRYLIGSYLIDHERLEQRAFYLGFSEIALQPLGGYRFDTHFADIINAVTPADIQRVAQTYFSGNPAVSLLLPGNPNAGVLTE